MLFVSFMIFFQEVVFSQDNTDIALANEYYQNDELEKAQILYEKLIKNKKNIPLVHSNYFNLLLNTNQFKEAEKYIKELIKDETNRMIYQIDLGRIYARQNDKEKEQEYFNEVIQQVKNNPTLIRITAQYLVNNQLTEYAVKAYSLGRKESGNPYDFSLELANAYRLLNNYDQMINEYINFAHQNPSNLKYVKNVFQNILTEEEDLTSLETYLIDKVQSNPNDRIFSELLIWVNLQQKNFYGAYIQARAIDKRQGTNGAETMDVGIIALKNNDYSMAIKIFNYIIEEYPSSINYPLAKTYIIKAREELIKNTYPIDQNEIKNLIHDYATLIHEFGINNTTLEALRSTALLHAFYLDEYDSAISILERIVEVPRISATLKSKCKLDLGDIYLLIDKPWESTLLYSQVEKSMKETPVGYEAKLKNAKLNFYKGEFSLAQEHLDILKLATTREIANDAMSLSLLIQDNSVFDSTQQALKEYAAAELLLFRHRKNEALDSLKIMIDKYSGHNIQDEVLFLMAKVYMEMGEFQSSIEALNKVVNEYRKDILSDDAYFLMGKIYEEQLNDDDKAMEIYQDFLKQYPGSLFTAEARKRFRKSTYGAASRTSCTEVNPTRQCIMV